MPRIEYADAVTPLCSLVLRLPTAKHIRVPGAGRPGAKPWEKTPLSTTGASNEST